MHICPCWHNPSRLWAQFSVGAPSVTLTWTKAGQCPLRDGFSTALYSLEQLSELREDPELHWPPPVSVPQLSLSQGCHWLLLECGRWLSPGLCCHSAGISTKFPSRRAAKSTSVLLAGLARCFPPSLALCITPAFAF